MIECRSFRRGRESVWLVDSPCIFETSAWSAAILVFSGHVLRIYSFVILVFHWPMRRHAFQMLPFNCRCSFGNRFATTGLAIGTQSAAAGKLKLAVVGNGGYAFKGPLRHLV